MVLMTVLPALTLMLFLNLTPIIWSVAAGFNEIGTYDPTWTWVGLENYQRLVESPGFYESMVTGVIFTGASILVQLVLGTGLALLVNRAKRLKSLTRTVLLVPYLIPTAVLAYMGLWMNNSTWGITNQMFVQAGLIESFIPWYGLPKYAMPAVVATFSWKYTAFVTILVLAKLQSIPDTFYEAAKISGASTYQAFRDITLPNLKSVIFIVLLLRSVWTFNKFDIIWILTRGGPGTSTTTPPVYAFELGFQRGSLGLAAATSVALFAILSIVAVIYFLTLSPEEEVTLR